MQPCCSPEGPRLKKMLMEGAQCFPGKLQEKKKKGRKIQPAIRHKR